MLLKGIPPGGKEEIFHIHANVLEAARGGFHGFRDLYALSVWG